MDDIGTSIVAPDFSGALVSPEIYGRLSGVCKALCLGLAITAAQILCAMLLSGQPNLAKGYASLYAWDGGWYAGILREGYRSPPVLSEKDFGNVAFFPGYPLAATGVRQIF